MVQLDETVTISTFHKFLPFCSRMFNDVQWCPMMFNDVHGGSNYVVSDNPSSQEIANPILRLLRHHRDENGKLAYSLGGYQHNSLFRNNGDGTFTEVGYLENADRLEDGYIVAAVDI